jgi:hypothetical protein
MKCKYWKGLLLSLFCVSVNAAMCGANRVVYVTLDGLAPYEITPEQMPYLYSHLIPKGVMLGTAGDTHKMEVASIPKSFPSYLSQMTGAVQDCDTNECPRVGVETFPETLKRELQLDQLDVAIFASWEPIQRAVEHIKGTLYVDSGDNGSTRDDETTFLKAAEYFFSMKPRFAWLSLDASDHYAHEEDRENFLLTLKDYDRYLKSITGYVSHDDCTADNTWFVITTDHGRGLGDQWGHHGTRWPYSKNTWMLIVNSHDLVRDDNQKTPIPYDMRKDAYSTLDIKPMILSMMGVKG